MTSWTADNDPDTVHDQLRAGEAPQSERGDAAGAFASAPVKLDQTYVTPAETHVPIELQGNNRDVGRRQTDDLRGIASRLQHARACSRRCLVYLTRRTRHHRFVGFRFRQQTLAVDTLSAGGGGGASGRQAGQARA